MSLKREIAELEQVEEMQEEEELTEERRQAEQRSIDEKVVGLYRRINIIVEYIDNQTREVTTITEEQLRQDERHFREEGIRKAWELKALELTQKNKDITKLLKEKENEKNIIWDNAFQEGVRYAMGVRESRSVRSDKKEKEQSEKSQETDRPKTEKSRVVGLGRAVGDV